MRARSNGLPPCACNCNGFGVVPLGLLIGCQQGTAAQCDRLRPRPVRAAGPCFEPGDRFHGALGLPEANRGLDLVRQAVEGEGVPGGSGAEVLQPAQGVLIPAEAEAEAEVEQAQCTRAPSTGWRRTPGEHVLGQSATALLVSFDRRQVGQERSQQAGMVSLCGVPRDAKPLRGGGQRVAMQPEETAAVATQLMGMALCRFVLRLPPVVSMTRDEIIAWLVPTIERYLTGSP